MNKPIKTFSFSTEYFNVVDTLECGQIFRYFKLDAGKYLLISKNHPCIITQNNSEVLITVYEEDEGYFYNYFDLNTDYNGIFSRATASNYPVLVNSAKLGKGVRILKQDSEEMIISFLISQNNNIPRIKNSLNKICELLGEKSTFCGYEYYAFPTLEKMSLQTADFYKSCGLGYRAEYMLNVCSSLNNGLINRLNSIEKNKRKEELVKIKGIGEKVADCVLLFGMYQTDSFPVDTWIEKIYREDFNGLLTDRKKITEFFISQFGSDSGYFQQYLFYYKRTLSKK
ncbi:MAG: hypothetical protein IKJ19_04820 [Clostridia bacterium]|nr:hypothetical protein [Clostridia bacterium]